MITYDYYRIFYYVAQYKSFTRAAEALHNNQPNITRCMNNLESELNCTLFLRSNKGITLTPEGKDYMNMLRLPMSSCRLGKMRSVRIGISKMDWFPSEPVKMRCACYCFRYQNVFTNNIHMCASVFSITPHHRQFQHQRARSSILQQSPHHLPSKSHCTKHTLPPTAKF